MVEEIARIIGYDEVPSSLPPWRPQSLEFDERTPKLWQLKSLLVGLGLFEVMTYSFVSEELAWADTKQHLKVANPLSREQAYLRRTVIPSLLQAVGRNDRYRRNFGMFELTRVFIPGSDHGQLPDEPFCLTVLVKGGEEVYLRVKGVLDALAAGWGLELEVRPSADDPKFLPGRVAQVKLGRKTIGLIGELNPEVVAAAEVTGRVAVLEVKLDEMLEAVKPITPELPGRFPSLIRDINLQLGRKVAWDQVARTINDTGLAKPYFVNDYYSEDLAPDRKNLAVRLVMSDPTKTLTDGEAAARVKIILAHLHKELGAEAAQ